MSRVGQDSAFVLRGLGRSAYNGHRITNWILLITRMLKKATSFYSLDYAAQLRLWNLNWPLSSTQAEVNQQPFPFVTYSLHVPKSNVGISLAVTVQHSEGHA